MSHRIVVTRRAASAAALVLSAALGACSGTPVESATPSRIRFANAFASGNAVNVTVDGQSVVSSLPFRSTTDLTVVAPGTHTVSVVDAATGQTLLTMPVTVGQNTDVTMVGAGVTDSTRAILLADDNLAAAPTGAQVRFVNAMSTANAIDVFVSQPNAFAGSTFPATASAVAFGSATPFVPSNAGMQQLVFTMAGQRADIINTDPQTVDLVAGTSTTFVATPGLAGVGGPAFLVINGATATNPTGSSIE